MACPANRDGVASEVIAFLNDQFERNDITEKTDLEADLGLDDLGKRALAVPIARHFQKKMDCRIGVPESAYEGADTVGDIIDLIWKDIKGA